MAFKKKKERKNESVEMETLLSEKAGKKNERTNELTKKTHE